MHYLVEQGVTEVIELGSKQVLVSLMNKIAKNIVPYSLGQPSDLTILANSQARQDKLLTIRKHKLSQLMSTALTSRNYSQDPAIYNKTVEPLFPKLQRMKEQLDNPRHELSEAEIQDSIVLCELIFAAKQSPMNAKAMISTI